MIFESLASILESIIFFNILFFTPYQMPVVVFFTLLCTVYFSIKFNFINIRGLKASIKIFLEKEGETDGNKAITSKAAFLSAISGCVGVGSISGVAAALFSGGPGAVFWMLVIGFVIMPVRYAEVFLGHFFRTKEEDGTISNYGPYAYIKNGLVQEGYSKKLSKFLFIFYVVSMLFGSVGALLMQSNPMSEIAGHLFFNSNRFGIFFCSLLLASASVFVISGGLKRMVHTMENAVSVMSVIYVISIVLILILNIKNIPGVFTLIFAKAFEIKSVFGGIIGVLIISFTRVVVSTEVGFGTVSLLHGKSQNNDSVREGLLSMVGPFVVNFIFITLNSIAVLASIGYNNDYNGILMINKMFESVHQFFPFLLLIITILFGFTTIIAWYFYAESSLKQLTKKQSAINIYRIFFFLLISVSGLISFDVVIRIIDCFVMSMTFPNITALILLGGVVSRELKKSKYFNK